MFPEGHLCELVVAREIRAIVESQHEPEKKE